MTRTRTTRALAAILAFLLFATLLMAGIPARAADELVLKEGAAITYNKDAAVMKADAIKALVDFEASGIPADASMDDFDLEYSVFGIDAVLDLVGDNKLMRGAVELAKARGLTNLWANAEDGVLDTGMATNVTAFIQNQIEELTGLGISHIQAGDEQTVRVRYNNGEWVNGTLTVNKANVKVTVKSTALYWDQVVGENFVTTDPEDDFMIFTFYSGITTDLAPTIYFQPPQNALLDKAVALIDKALEAMGKETLTATLRNGTTVGELTAMAKQITEILQDLSQQPLMKAVLESAGVDVDMVNGLVEGMQAISGIADNWRVAIGQPDRAGAYVVSAVAINRNYNPGIGAGVLLVKMRMFGVSLQWKNQDATFTVGDEMDLSAVAVYEGKEYPSQRMLYTYVGLTEGGSPFLGTDAPTEAGKYLQAAFTLGGNFLAIPIVRVVTISAAA